jgi:ADP-dependent NAD(P)H-hydrate dehydratase / NAD(P)H-hydrate epimerase
MQIYNADQIKAWDKFTIVEEQISSFDLMNRAAKCLVDAFLKYKISSENTIHIFCGPGNNGGDGMLMAAALRNKFYNVVVYACRFTHTVSPDFENALHVVTSYNNIKCIQLLSPEDLPEKVEGIIIDALFGSGLSRPLESYWLTVINKINNYQCPIYAIDLPSGMTVHYIENFPCVKATVTLTIQSLKESMLYENNQVNIGELEVIDIGLSKNFNVNSKIQVLDHTFISASITQRSRFSHKGTYGHALLIAGSKNMAGAALLNAKSCATSGVGVVSLMSTNKVCNSLTTYLPIAITKHISSKIESKKYTAIGIGSGLSQSKRAIEKVQEVLKSIDNNLVIDADALNIIAKENLLQMIPTNAILTPHPKEFDRLFGLHNSHYERVQTQVRLSQEMKIYIILKYAYTAISTPDGVLYFNISGNAGMAKGGSGDVLTGLITGILAKTKDPLSACTQGVYIHAAAGDEAAFNFGKEAMLPSDIIDFIPNVWKRLN